MDKVIGVAELRKSMASVIKEVHEKGSHYVIIQRSKAKAVLLSPEEVETLEVMADKELLEDIKQAKEDFLHSRFSTYEDFFDEKLPEKPAKREKSQKPVPK
jgi:PHD/YefM family antitoxin component YafN of YafNO toxin-antitoxin module